jgi:hypothetical protein
MYVSLLTRHTFENLNKANTQSFVADQYTLKDYHYIQGRHLEHSFPLFFRIVDSFLRRLSIYQKKYSDDIRYTPLFPTSLPRHNSTTTMMDRIGSAPSVDMMGKLSVRVLDSVRPFHLVIKGQALMTAPTSIPDNPLPSLSSLDQLPVCPAFTSSLPYSQLPSSLYFSAFPSSRPTARIITPFLMKSRADG